MHKEEVDLFVKALKSANEEFYVEAINEFRTLIKKFPNRNYVMIQNSMLAYVILI